MLSFRDNRRRLAPLLLTHEAKSLQAADHRKFMSMKTSLRPEESISTDSLIGRSIENARKEQLPCVLPERKKTAGNSNLINSLHSKYGPQRVTSQQVLNGRKLPTWNTAKRASTKDQPKHCPMIGSRHRNVTIDDSKKNKTYLVPEVYSRCLK